MWCFMYWWLINDWIKGDTVVHSVSPRYLSPSTLTVVLSTLLKLKFPACWTNKGFSYLSPTDFHSPGDQTLLYLDLGSQLVSVGRFFLISTAETVRNCSLFSTRGFVSVKRGCRKWGSSTERASVGNESPAQQLHMADICPKVLNGQRSDRQGLADPAVLLSPPHSVWLQTHQQSLQYKMLSL